MCVMNKHVKNCPLTVTKVSQSITVCSNTVELQISQHALFFLILEQSELQAIHPTDF